MNSTGRAIVAASVGVVAGPALGIMRPGAVQKNEAFLY
jgi:hypothetical protein